jgi:hypothetical protein
LRTKVLGETYVDGFYDIQTRKGKDLPRFSPSVGGKYLLLLV